MTERSPHLLDISEDKEFLATNDYALCKARGEDILENSNYDNWTMVRPAITYSKFRFQLVTLEAQVVVRRIAHRQTVVLPDYAMAVQRIMTRAGDVAEMIARLVGNKKARRERYLVSTAEHHTWREIADDYRELGGLRHVTADSETYLQIVCPGSRDDRWPMSST